MRRRKQPVKETPTPNSESPHASQCARKDKSPGHRRPFLLTRLVHFHAAIWHIFAPPLTAALPPLSIPLEDWAERSGGLCPHVDRVYRCERQADGLAVRAGGDDAGLPGNSARLCFGARIAAGVLIGPARNILRQCQGIRQRRRIYGVWARDAKAGDLVHPRPHAASERTGGTRQSDSARSMSSRSMS